MVQSRQILQNGRAQAQFLGDYHRTPDHSQPARGGIAELDFSEVLIKGFLKSNTSTLVPTNTTVSFHLLNNRVGKLSSLRRPANVAGAHLTLFENFQQRILGSIRGFAFVKIAQHEDA